MLLLTGHVLHADLLGRVRASFPLAPLCLHSRSAPPVAVPGAPGLEHACCAPPGLLLLTGSLTAGIPSSEALSDHPIDKGSLTPTPRHSLSIRPRSVCF